MPRSLFFALLISSRFVLPELAPAAGNLVFNRDVRPILSDACFQCHGPDEKNRKAGLRLDLAEPALRPAKSGATPITPGKPAESEVIARIFLDPADSDLMPPHESGKVLSDEQKQILRTWIEQGATYQGHWAFLPPQRPDVPASPGASHPVDAFLLDRLEEEGLTMQPEADRATLLRRVSLDLTGLPPTLAEQDAFEKDLAPGAYERVVDRLLDSPHFGERMAIEWLDLARYADSNGYQTDGSRQMWLWRDWLIQTYNRNLPFDQFTIEQLAGDLLPNPTRDQLIATGFNRNHRLNGEGGRIEEEWFVETVIDRVETTGMTWMALTLNCARCHDHKYDPVTQREFYQLFSFFNSVEESGVLHPEGKNGINTPPLLRVPSSAQMAQITALEAKIASAKTAHAKAEAQMPAAFADWESSARARLLSGKSDPTSWTPLAGESAKSLGGATLTRQPDGSWLAGGRNAANDTYEITGPLNEGRFGGILLEVFPDPSLPNQSLGRGSNGNFVLTGIELTIQQPDQSKASTFSIPLAKAVASFEQSGWPVSSIVDPAAKSRGWAIEGNAPDKRLARRAMFLPASPVQIVKDSRLTARLRHASGFGDHNIGRFRLSVTQASPDLASLDGGSDLPPAIRRILALSPNDRSPADLATLKTHFREAVENPVRQAKSALDAATAERVKFEESLPSTMIMKERPTPRPAFLLTRGEYDRPADKVNRALPAALPPLPPGAPMNRLGLAQWIVSGEHPLTARVWVNRTWERLFGIGIVKTSENFGSQAEWPMHPELLDWLAVEFTSPTVLPSVHGRPATSWDMKAMLKFLATSRAYRQSSAATPTLIRKDPDNRLLARGPRFRLRGELLRDQALAVSGLLTPAIGGPSVRPYMPKGVWEETTRYGDLRNYKPDTGADLYRRTMYTIWKRTAAPPTMLIFDSPTREVCSPKRSRTNTPLQALALLNEVTFVEAARALAERMLREGGSSSEARLTTGYRIACGRRPDPATLTILRQGLDARLAHYATAPEAARQLITHGSSKPDPTFPAAELAAYTVTANVLLNLDRVITRD
ncbi:MAG: Protein of unknown function DUF1553/DUF1549/Planctomycete cytochrome C [Verrucomicrobia bacterium]|nr:MAG: Protein of unknown function DUF1553/DUF1549/Planctomycete cytochrome C [Verrucomicrobiota bacterium]